MAKTPRIPIPTEVRKYVYQRDNYRYQSCGQNKNSTQLSIESIVPLALDGSNDISNLQTLTYPVIGVKNII
jgi:5-methylcytosine-specific restriction endonuclease McrA